jgi:hypothetical protein
MKLLDPTFFHHTCDYSFGDQSGYQNGILSIKNANLENSEFTDKVDEILKSGKNFMTLFIDNIRLYKRSGIKYTANELVNEYSKKFKDNIVRELFETNDLLYVCSQIKEVNFIIFTGFEDTPIDDEIFDKIPDNVLNIFASNAISFGGKVKPIPYGIKRRMNPFDKNQEFLIESIGADTEPKKSTYLNFSITNPIRQTILENLKSKSWITCETKKLNYKDYLNEIKNHKFVICPEGNAIGCECHREWETIYLKRVPIVIDTKYTREIFKGFPVLFVNDFNEITEQLLIENEFLFEEIQKVDLNLLNFEFLYDTYIEETLKNNL